MVFLLLLHQIRDTSLCSPFDQRRYYFHRRVVFFFVVKVVVFFLFLFVALVVVSFPFQFFFVVKVVKVVPFSLRVISRLPSSSFSALSLSPSVSNLSVSLNRSGILSLSLFASTVSALARLRDNPHRVWDAFVRWQRRNHVPVGTPRGLSRQDIVRTISTIGPDFARRRFCVAHDGVIKQKSLFFQSRPRLGGKIEAKKCSKLFKNVWGFISEKEK